MAKRYNILTRCLAALALLFVYVASTSAILVGATTSPAQAWRGGARLGLWWRLGLSRWPRLWPRLWLLWWRRRCSGDPVAGGMPTASASADTIDICVTGVT